MKLISKELLAELRDELVRLELQVEQLKEYAGLCEMEVERNGGQFPSGSPLYRGEARAAIERQNRGSTRGTTR